MENALLERRTVAVCTRPIVNGFFTTFSPNTKEWRLNEKTLALTKTAEIARRNFCSKKMLKHTILSDPQRLFRLKSMQIIEKHLTTN